MNFFLCFFILCFLLYFWSEQLSAPLLTEERKGKTVAKRPDISGSHKWTFQINKKKIFATQDTCGICGKPVDFGLKYPHPFSACIDHIIPVAKGGHPSDISNLQLAHWTCNRQKSDKLFAAKNQQVQVISNRDLPQSRDWRNYKSI